MCLDRSENRLVIFPSRKKKKKKTPNKCKEISPIPPAHAKKKEEKKFHRKSTWQIDPWNIFENNLKSGQHHHHYWKNRIHQNPYRAYLFFSTKNIIFIICFQTNKICLCGRMDLSEWATTSKMTNNFVVFFFLFILVSNSNEHWNGWIHCLEPINDKNIFILVKFFLLTWSLS